MRSRRTEGFRLKPLRVKHSEESGGGSKEERTVMANFEVMANLFVTNVGTPSMVVEVDGDMVLGAVKVGHDEGPEMKCCTGPKKT